MAVNCIITMPMDGTNGDSGTEDPYHVAGYTIEQFSADSSTFSGDDTEIVDVRWSAEDGWTANGRHAYHRFDTVGTHVVVCTITGNAGGTSTATRNFTSAAFAPTWDRYVKPLADGGNDSATGLDDAHAWATIEHAFDRWQSSGLGQGVYGAIRLKRGSTIAFTGLADGTHDPSPKHGFLICTTYGSGALPLVNFTNGKQITCLEASGVPLEWGWPVYVRDWNCVWAARDEDNGIFLGNPGSQCDGVQITNGGTVMQGNRKHAFVGGFISRSGTNGMFASTAWCVVANATLDRNTLSGVDAEHQLYGSAGLHHYLFQALTVVATDQGNDGLRSVSAALGLMSDCNVSAIKNAGAAYFPSCNTDVDDACVKPILERCTCSNIASTGAALDMKKTTDALIRNCILGDCGGVCIVVQGFDPVNRCDNARLYNLTIVGNDSYDLQIDANATNTKMKNCILYRGDSQPFFTIEDAADLTSDYNCFWREGGTPGADTNFCVVNGVTLSFEDWRDLGKDSHSIFADPKFTDVLAGDVTLQPISPCIAAGLYLREVPRDYLDVPRTVPYTIGAYHVDAEQADTTPPSVSMIGSSGATVTGTVTLRASAIDDVGVVGVQFKVDTLNVGAEDFTDPYQLSWDSTTVPDGEHIVTAVARDAAGNTGESPPMTVIVDNSEDDTLPPDVAVTFPVNGHQVSGTILISVAATDNVEVSLVTVSVDAILLGATISGAPGFYSIHWDTRLVSNGPHVITATATDPNGNTATSDPITVQVANLSDGGGGGGGGGGGPPVLVGAGFSGRPFIVKRRRRFPRA